VTKIGILVGENKLTFFEKIYDDLSTHYQTDIYERKFYNIPLLHGRLNRWAFQKGIYSMLHRNDICFFEWASELLMIASHMPKKCIIITRLHSFELYDWAPKIYWENVDKVILVSRAMQLMFNELYPEHRNKTEVIYNGCSVDKFVFTGQREFRFTLGMLGRVSPIKRVYEMILVFHSLVKKGYDAKLLIAGDPDDDYRYAVAVHRLVRELGLQDKVVFFGHVSDTATWLQEIDIFISNSYWEGQQVALLEAMASGCYCLSHFWSGVGEMLPFDNIFWKGDELEQKIIEYSKLPETQKTKKQMDLRMIACEKFDIENTKTQIRKIINEIR